MRDRIRTLYAILVPRGLSWSVRVKSDVKLAVMLLRVLPLIFGNVSPTKVKSLWHFARTCVKMHRNQGPKGLALYLKASAVILQQVAGGMRAGSPWALGANVARTRSGIPTIVAKHHRIFIKRGDVEVIRFWLTLLGLYREVEFKGKLKLKTIMADGLDIQAFRSEWQQFVPLFYDRLYRLCRQPSHTEAPWKLTAFGLPAILTSSPGSEGQTSVIGLTIDCLAWYSNTELWEKMVKWCRLTGSLEIWWGFRDLFAIFDRIGGPELLKSWGKPLYLGALAFLEEPGKIRVVAMVDLITQGVMKPLHDKIFSLLRAIPTDGTFNQIRPIRRLVRRMEVRNQKFCASYDLSAATDRLPVDLQVDLLSGPLGSEKANLWKDLLVGREYRLPRIGRSFNLGFNTVKYKVGQPMGALSSWAMLALTHHAIVQFAAMKCGVAKELSWFREYGLLGDDIVIADKAVAAEYLRIMEVIGVEVGLAKSLVSHTGSLEFAKRTFIRGRDCSPVSLAEVLVALSNVNALAELFRKNASFKKLKLAHVARFAGFGYKNLGRLPVGLSLNNRLARLIAYLCRPGGLMPMPFEAWLTAAGPGAEGTIPPNSVWHAAKRVWESILGSVLDAEVRVERMLSQGYGFLLSEAATPKGKLINTWLRRVVPQGDLGAMNGLWREEIIRPTMDRLRARFEEIDDQLRILDPFVMPEFSSLEDIWKRVFDLDEGLASLPKEMTFVRREDVKPIASTRIITWWKNLRPFVLRERAEVMDIGVTRAKWPAARRRRKGA